MTTAAALMIEHRNTIRLISGGGVRDIAFLGFGEINTNGKVFAPGGVAQKAKQVVVCVTFDTKSARLVIGNGRLNKMQFQSRAVDTLPKMNSGRIKEQPSWPLERL